MESKGYQNELSLFHWLNSIARIKELIKKSSRWSPWVCNIQGTSIHNPCIHFFMFVYIMQYNYVILHRFQPLSFVVFPFACLLRCPFLCLYKCGREKMNCWIMGSIYIKLNAFFINSLIEFLPLFDMEIYTLLLWRVKLSHHLYCFR